MLSGLEQEGGGGGGGGGGELGGFVALGKKDEGSHRLPSHFKPPSRRGRQKREDGNMPRSHHDAKGGEQGLLPKGKLGGGPGV